MKHDGVGAKHPLDLLQPIGNTHGMKGSDIHLVDLAIRLEHKYRIWRAMIDAWRYVGNLGGGGREMGSVCKKKGSDHGAAWRLALFREIWEGGEIGFVL